MTGKLRIALVDATPDSAAGLEAALAEAGCEVVARLGDREGLCARVAELAPDVVIVAMRSPDRGLLEDMKRIHRDQPRPIVMFVDESDAASIRAAVDAGVSAYVVDGLEAGRVRPIIEVAIARFEAFQALLGELEAARASLLERKVIDRAKGVLMTRRGVDEGEAYRLLRKTAMDRQMKLADVARQVIEMAELI